MRCVVQHRGIVNGQDQRLLAHGLAGLFPVRLLDGRERGRFLSAQAIESAQVEQFEHLGKRLLWMGGDLRCRVDQPPGASLIAHIRCAKGPFRPQPCIGHAIHDNLAYP